MERMENDNPHAIDLEIFTIMWHDGSGTSGTFME